MLKSQATASESNLYRFRSFRLRPFSFFNIRNMSIVIVDKQQCILAKSGAKMKITLLLFF
jgi:hypothetical protein